MTLLPNQFDRDVSPAMLIAHIDPDDSGHTEPLSEHLTAVRQTGGQFGRRFGCGVLAGFLGGSHDFGKAAPDVQDYLWDAAGDSSEEEREAPQGANPRHGPDHSSAGAQFSEKAIPGIGLLLAYAAAGHHAGMPDGIGSSSSSLESRLHKTLPDWESKARKELPADLFECDLAAVGKEARPFLSLGDGYSLAFLTRMLFSCLVDADFLATERFMDGNRSQEREGVAGRDFVSLQGKLDDYFERLAGKAATGGLSGTSVNAIREEVRADCIAAATLSAGLFSLTVPTGGGKTRPTASSASDFPGNRIAPTLGFC